jgi:hypothetical protein
MARAKAQKTEPIAATVYEQVEKLASIGCTFEEIATVLGITPWQLSKRRKSDTEFEQRIQKGLAHFKVSLRRMQYQAAQKGNVAMLIWLGKQVLGQTDKVDVNGELRETFVVEVPAKQKTPEDWESKWNPRVVEGGAA